MYGVVRCTSVHGALWTDVSCSYLLSMTVDWIGLILVASGTGCLPKRNKGRESRLSVESLVIELNRWALVGSGYYAFTCCNAEEERWRLWLRWQCYCHSRDCYLPYSVLQFT